MFYCKLLNTLQKQPLTKIYQPDEINDFGSKQNRIDKSIITWYLSIN